MSAPEPLSLQVLVPATAQLVLQLPDGTTRAPTAEELRLLKLKSESEMYHRLRDMLKALRDDDDDETIAALRYFVEYVTTYDHDPSEAIEGLRARLIWDAPEHGE